MASLPPKLFISYSWTNSDHEAWVLQLATELCNNGVDVVIDKWNLREGHDSYAFMEKMVTDKEITKVLLICDRAYAEKANVRTGGVGTEAQIISPEIYAKREQDKFVAVVVERDENGHPCLPAYYRSRIFIDLSDSSRFSENFEKLLRWIYDKPLHVKPELGPTPKFLTAELVPTLGTSSLARRASDSIRGGREIWYGATSEYLSTFADNLGRFRLGKSDTECDEKLLQNIESFLPNRNEFITLLFALAQYQDNKQVAAVLHRFFELLFPYLDPPETVTSWKYSDFDNFRFIVHELFLYAIAILLKYERFNTVGSLLQNNFYVPNRVSRNTDGIVSFSNLFRPIDLLEHRNQRLEMRRLSLRADILEKRSYDSGIQFRQLMQADFVLFVRDSLERLKKSERKGRWDPVTLVYAERQDIAFELFARSQSKAYFTRLFPVFDISSKVDFDSLVAAFNDARLDIPSWGFNPVNVTRLMGYARLQTCP